MGKERIDCSCWLSSKKRRGANEADFSVPCRRIDSRTRRTQQPCRPALAPWVFLGEPRTYLIHVRTEDVLVRVCLFSPKLAVRWKKKSRQNKTEQRTTAHAACTAASTERRAHRTAHLVAARVPAACIYFSVSIGYGLLSAVVSKARKNISRSNDASGKQIQKSKLQEEHPTKNRRAHFIFRG